MSIEALAQAFSEEVRGELSAAELADVNTANSSDENGPCATHDYCDANMLMAEAFTRIMGREFDYSDADAEIWNAAWAMAKHERFYA